MLIRRTFAAALAGLIAQAAVADDRLYPNGDHYVQLPSDWYSYNHFRVGAAYAYAKENGDTEADGVAPTLDFTVPAITHQAEDGAFGPDDDSSVELFARGVAYFKLKNALDLRIAAGVMGDPFADVSLDFRITRGFSIAPTLIYRDIESQDLWAIGFTLGFHYGEDR